MINYRRLNEIGVILMLFLLGGIGTASSTPKGGLAEYERVIDTETALTGAATFVRAICPSGKIVLGGGYQTAAEFGTLEVFQSIPQITGNSLHAWQVGVVNPFGPPAEVSAFAICARLEE